MSSLPLVNLQSAYYDKKKTLSDLNSAFCSPLSSAGKLNKSLSFPNFILLVHASLLPLFH